MFRPRVIPVLLLKNQGLVKSVKFKDYKYIGDPINAVKIFNDKKADELIFLDITATLEKRKVSLKLIQNIGDETNMPFAVGGGIRSIQDIKEILNAGAEKVCINSYAVENPQFIRVAADTFGSSTIVVSIDVKKKTFGKEQVYIQCGQKATGLDPVVFAKQMQEMGAGEIMITSIEHDGIMQGYHLELIKKVADAVSIPVIACGGAANYNDLRNPVEKANASAVAAGSLFVYHGPRRAVLINFPPQKELQEIFKIN